LDQRSWGKHPATSMTCFDTDRLTSTSDYVGEHLYALLV
jgi:hypothetical protein